MARASEGQMVPGNSFVLGFPKNRKDLGRLVASFRRNFTVLPIPNINLAGLSFITAYPSSSSVTLDSGIKELLRQDHQVFFSERAPLFDSGDWFDVHLSHSVGDGLTDFSLHPMCHTVFPISNTHLRVHAPDVEKEPSLFIKALSALNDDTKVKIKSISQSSSNFFFEKQGTGAWSNHRSPTNPWLNQPPPDKTWWCIVGLPPTSGQRMFPPR